MLYAAKYYWPGVTEVGLGQVASNQRVEGSDAESD
jgi:hypothetical protein